jgi:hypothetical protein
MILHGDVDATAYRIIELFPALPILRGVTKPATFSGGIQ